VRHLKHPVPLKPTITHNSGLLWT